MIGAVALLDAVAVDVPAECAAAPPPPPYARGSACGRLLLYNPLALLLGWALALALVPAMAALNAAWAMVASAAGYARKGKWGEVLAVLLINLPITVLNFLPVLTKNALFAQWQILLDAGGHRWWLHPLLFALPVWRSPTAKLRAFAGAGDAGATRRLLGAGSGSGAAAAAAKRRLGQQLQRGVARAGGVDEKGAYGDNACLAVVARLLAAGAPVDAVNANGKSVLHEMCCLGNVSAAKALLAGGADPDLRDANGQTPLHLAARWNQRFAAMLLVAHGADPSLLDNGGKTPLMVVNARYNHAEATRAALRPAPTWRAIEQALAAAADGAAAARALLALLPACRQLAQLPLLPAGRELRQLQLFDLLWAETLEPDAAARMARRRLVFDQLITPLVRETPARPLVKQEKALLILACVATAGHRLGEAAAAREGHRQDFDALLRATMASFAAQLGDEYAAIKAQTGGAELVALPATELLGGIAKSELSQDAAAVGGPAPWLAVGSTWSFDGGKPLRVIDGDLAGAIRCALARTGAVAGPEELCDLLQGGRHHLLPAPRIKHFNHEAAPTAFWQHTCALQSVARHEPLNDEFHAHIKMKLDGVAGARFKEAPLKGFDRVAVKTADYHQEMGLPDTPAGAGAAAARVIDIVRCSFEVPSATAALALCAWLNAATLQEHGVCALRRKNGFHADAPSAGGYRDIKYNLLYQSPTVAGAMGRAIVEVQIIVEAYLKVKKKMHAVYRIDRGDFG